MNESTMNLSWLDDAKQDIEQWSASMPNDADNQPIDWRWVSSLDLRNGIGAATRQHVDLLAMLRSSSPQLSAPQLHALLKDDLAIRDRLEPTIAQCNSTFMMDYDRLIASYRLPRACLREPSVVRRNRCSATDWRGDGIVDGHRGTT